jgi:signal transduction histidine kinase/ActR/RegA family two-component response regulator
MRVTIARKFGLVGGLFTAGGVVAMAAFYWFIERSEPDAAFLYLAAQLKTTAHELLIYGNDVVDDGVDADRLLDAVARFERDLSSLEKGGPALRQGLPAAPEPVLDEIETLKQLWPPVKVRAGAISKSKPHDPEAERMLVQMRDEVGKLVMAADALRGAYEEHAMNRRRDMRIVLLGILGLDIGLLLAGWWITRQHVLRPVTLLAEGAARIRGGDFSKPVPITTNDELSGFARSFNDMAKDLVRSQEKLRQAERIRATGELAGGVAHDFNNRLTAILGATELLEAQLPLGTARERAAHIREVAQQAARLTRQLLAFGRKQQLKPEVIDFNEMVRASVERVLPSFGADVDVRVCLAPGLGAVEVDPEQLDQVIRNLLTNAREAMPAGGTLTIETRNRGADANLNGGWWLELVIRDTGEGVTPENLLRIFDPFFTTRPLHTGLGLSTAQGITLQSGGHLLAESRPGQGSAFRVLLPRTSAEPKKAPVKAPAARRRQLCVLLAEDDPDVRQLVHAILVTYGYEVLTAHTGEEAIRIASERTAEVDLLLTDVIMPGLDGADTARQLQKRWPAMKVLYMSGYAGELIAERGMLPEGTAFLQKPFTIRDLMAEIERALGVDAH